MKQILYKIQFMFVLAALSQMLLSCSEPETLTRQSVDVTFTTTLQNDVLTKASEGTYKYGSGSHATTLLVAVFDNKETPQLIGKHEFTIDPLSASGNEVTLSLAREQTYNILFWAYNKDADAFDFEGLPKVTMKVPRNVMTFDQADARDAFYAVTEFTTTSGKTPEPITLKRPLAQINVGTSGTAAKASFTIKNNANTFHPFTGEISGEADFTWTYAETSTKTFSVEIDGTDKTYKYLALGYMFAPLGEETKAVRKACVLKFAETNDEIPFQDVELHANCRSNIVGGFTK